FLNAILGHKKFQSGDISTNFITEHFPDGFTPAQNPSDNPAWQIIVAACMYNIHKVRANQLSGQFTGTQRSPDEGWVVLTNDTQHKVQVEQEADSHFVRYNENDYVVTTSWMFGQPLFHCTINNEPATFQVERQGIWYHIEQGGTRSTLLVLTNFAASLYHYMPEKSSSGSDKFHLSPMPGLIIKLSVEAGQEVEAGEELAVIEAMKMENVLIAERDAKVTKVLVDLNESVSVDQPIIEFE
ncbi:MAG: hypothetical protein L3J67_12615, partial [Hyphomicrobiaceae bacterium]|nr:hypothetical protein [Hyphomicrobiaceae bacterium]